MDENVYVGVIMGSCSDWDTMHHVCVTLKKLKVPFETKVVSAHRTPDLLFEYAGSAADRGLRVIIAGAGGAAHLPGMAASKTYLPVIGVPVESRVLRGVDSLLSIVQMPAGIPVATVAIGKAGAINSAILAASILSAEFGEIREALQEFRKKQTDDVLAHPDPAGAVKLMLVGVLGGGQLGRMLGLMGIALGVDFRFWDPSPDAPAASTGELICGAYDDEASFAQFAKGLDVVTYEFENIPASTLDRLLLLGAMVSPGKDSLEIRPGRRALEVSQDRATEKRFFAEAGVPTGEWMQADSLEDLYSALDLFGAGIVKTRRFGYDGKGQKRIESKDDCVDAWDDLGKNSLIIEKVVPFDRELSLIGVRGINGEIRTWPLVENVHNHGILHRTTAPAANVDEALQLNADNMLRSIMEALNYTGVLTIEFFEVNGELTANEMAPRVHNSGHWTIEGAVTCQFENHVRAITGLPLGSTAPRFSSVMLNCIGSMPPAEKVLQIEGAHLHDYGKLARKGRKVGHITVCDEPTGGPSLHDKVTLLDELVSSARTMVL